MNKTNIIAMLLLLAAAGTAMANGENNSSVILDVNISSECYAAGVPINITVEVGNFDDKCDMDNLNVTANFTGDNVSVLVILAGVKCGDGDNCATMNFTGNVTIDVAGVDVTCEIVATDLSGECAVYIYEFPKMSIITSVVIDSGYPGNFMVGNVNTGKHDFTATCYNVCSGTVDCGNVNWSCSNGYVATINSSTGELVANNTGVANVTATSDNVSDVVNITVEIEDEEDDTPPATYSRGSSVGTYPPGWFDDDSDDSDSDSADTDDAVVIDDAVVVPGPVDIPDVVVTPTTENTIDADIEHPDDDDGVNILWLFAGAVAIIAIVCAAVIKRRT